MTTVQVHRQPDVDGDERIYFEVVKDLGFDPFSEPVEITAAPDFSDLTEQLLPSTVEGWLTELGAELHAERHGDPEQ